MFIKTLEVNNFRSFRHLLIEPSDFNVLIGPNASGKTNFLQLFKFLRDIVNLGLENAVSMQGGIEYLQNIQESSGTQTDFNIKIDYSPTDTIARKEIRGEVIEITPLTLQLKFSIQNAKYQNDYTIVSDYLLQTFVLKSGNSSCKATLELNKTLLSDKVDLQKTLKLEHLTGTKLQLTVDDIVPLPFLSSYSTKRLLFEDDYHMPYPNNINGAFRKLPIYDLDLLKDNASTSIIGKSRLEDNGNNVAIVLKHLLNDKERKREFFNYVKYVLPFVEDIEVEQVLDKHLQIKYSETYMTNEYIPASLMSSGTIALLAIIIGVFFEENEIMIFEEPGGRIHPFLISRIINMMQSAKAQSQIFITTHNPEIVKYAGIDNVFCLSRDATGFSTINKLTTKTDIIQFLENEIGLDELFVQNLLSK